MAVIDAPVSEILSLAHVESALTLSIEAGWNQTPDDWGSSPSTAERGAFSSTASLSRQPRR